MPERWQREVESWSRVEVPASLPDRVAAGPKGEGMPPSPRRGERLISGVLAVGVFGMALWFVVGAFRSDPPAADAPTDVAVVTLIAGDDDPQASLAYGGREAGVAVDSYCWNQANGAGKCVDFESPSPFASDAFLPVPAGTTVALENPDGAVVAWSIADGNDPTLLGVTATPEDVAALPSGRYVLTAAATWEGRGETITFHFALEIFAPTPTPTIGEGELWATFLVPDDGSRPTVTFTAGTVQRFDLCHGDWDGEPGECVTDLDVLYERLAPGTMLVLDGSADRVDATLSDAATGETQVLTFTSGRAALPRVEGEYVLRLDADWDGRGTVGVDLLVRIGPPSPADVAVPDVTGLRDQSALRTLDAAGLRWLVWFREIPDAERWTVVAQDPAPGTTLDPGSVVRLEIVTDVTSIPDVFAKALACEQVMGFGGPRVVILPAGEAFVRGNTGGIRRDDLVEPIEDGTPGDEGYWRVVRDGRVVAVISYETLDGVACAGSDVGGVP